jgi:allantoicase
VSLVFSFFRSRFATQHTGTLKRPRPIDHPGTETPQARFRVYGSAIPPPPTDPPTRIDLAYALNGGRLVATSNQHYGVASNLLLPGRGVDMGDGWETRRSRVKGHCEWAVVKL